MARRFGAFLTLALATALVSAFNRCDKRYDGFIAWSVNGGLVF